MKVLVINSDVAINRGYRAIMEGVVALIRETFPDAEITGISEMAERDANWFGISMLPQGVHSISPFDFIRLYRACKDADLVLWGGGEILKDYTNQLALWYWSLKMSILSYAASRLIGVFQGIGPTYNAKSKWLIVRTISRTNRFVVRDADSRKKLLAWGAAPEKVVASFDPAILVQEYTSRTSQDTAGPTGQPAPLIAAMAPRDWFHYRPGDRTPHHWWSSTRQTAANKLYRARLLEILDRLNERFGRVVLVPMHMTQDVDLCVRLRQQAQRPATIEILGEESLSPSDLRRALSKVRIMVAFRLHATIIASSAGVPTITYYYVDKGKAYTDQVGLHDFSRPVESLLEESAPQDFDSLLTRLETSGSLMNIVSDRIDEMRENVREVFRSATRQ
jgi:polysaccharide pyruvyl transferase WcaK-like protein